MSDGKEKNKFYKVNLSLEGETNDGNVKKVTPMKFGKVNFAQRCQSPNPAVGLSAASSSPSPVVSDKPGTGGAEKISTVKVDMMANANKLKVSWFANGFWTFFILGVVAMGIGLGVCSCFKKDTEIPILVCTVVLQAFWIFLIYMKSCDAIAEDGLDGFKRFYKGMVSGGVLCGFLMSLLFGILSFLAK